MRAHVSAEEKLETTRLSQLMYAIADAQRRGDHTRALRLVLSNFSRVSDASLLRERVAMTLAELGKKREAVEIFDLVGRHYANTGHAVRAISVAKQMAALNPDTDVLFDHIATIYNIRSPFLSEGVQSAFPEPTNIDLTAKEPQLSGQELEELAAARAMDQKGIATRPNKVPPIPFLSLLPEDAFKTVVQEVEFSVYDDATKILQKDEENPALIWTVTSDFVLHSDSGHFGVPSGALIGLNSFGQSKCGAEVDIFAQPGSETLQLNPSSVEYLKTRVPDFESRLSTLRRHSMTERLIRRHPMFSGLNDRMRVAVIETFTGMRVGGGEQVIAQDTPSPGLFIILDGEVDIVRNDGEWEITIATLKAGDVFGEIGLIANKPAMAGCTMTKDGHLLHLPRADFSALVARYPSVAEYTANLAEERLNEVTLSGNDLAEVD